jgi:hypothetical protein
MDQAPDQQGSGTSAGHNRAAFWKVTWRARAPALRASLLPFVLMLALHVAEDAISDVWAFAAPEALHVAIPGPVLLDGLYFMLDGLFLGLLLEALLSGRPLADSLPPLRPPPRVVYFALAMLPLGFVGGLLSWALRWGLSNALVALLDRQSDADLELPGSFSRELIVGSDLVISSSIFPLAVVGLAIAPVAVRLLELPRIRDADGHRISTVPSPSFFGAWVLAVLLNVLLDLLLQRSLAQLPLLGESALPALLSWYVANFTALTLIGSAIAIMLARRARQLAAA